MYVRRSHTAIQGVQTLPCILDAGFWPLLGMLLWQLTIYALVKVTCLLNMLFCDFCLWR